MTVDEQRENRPVEETAFGAVEEAVMQTADGTGETPVPHTVPETMTETQDGEPPADAAVEAETEEETAAGNETEAGEDDPLAGAFQYDTPPASEKRRWPIVLLAVLLAAVFVVGLLWAFGAFSADKGETPKEADGDAAASTTTAPAAVFGTEDVSDLTAAQSDHFEVSNGMFAFNLESIYQSFQSSYGYYLSSLGLDTGISTKEQAAYEGSGSWFDYFNSYAKGDVEWMLRLSEAARESGVTLDEADRAEIEEILESIDFSSYHNGVTIEDGRSFLEMYYTACAQEETLYAAMQFTDREVEDYYAAHSRDFDTCDYAYYVFSLGEDGEFATAQDAADAAASLGACRTAADFRRAVVDCLLAADGAAYATREAAELAYDANCVVEGAAYSSGDEVSAWLFADDTAVGNTKTVENDSSVAVYMLTAAPRRDTAKTVNVRHILLSADTCGSEDAAREQADALLALWRAGEATAASFAALAQQYTEDSNGAQGGLYEGVAEGDMLEEFNDWCFDESRRPGDSGLVKTSYGYHVMYFEGEQEAWYANALSAMKDAAYEEQYAAYQEQYAVTFFDENINKNDI